ncbi:MAG: hypothetical protein AB4352_28160 [Hormoscilla sp.]
MKRIQIISKIGLVGMVLIGFSVVILESLGRANQPMDTSQQLTATGQTPAELGQEQYLALVREAKTAVSQLPAGQAVTFPLGVNSPVRIGDGSGNSSQASEYQALGWMNLSGQPSKFTPADLNELFDSQINNLTRGNALTTPAGEILVADASGSVLLARRVAVIDLIVRNQQNNQVYLVKNVRFIAIFRDALNAALNGTVRVDDSASLSPEEQIPAEQI